MIEFVLNRTEKFRENFSSTSMPPTPSLSLPFKPFSTQIEENEIKGNMSGEDDSDSDEWGTEELVIPCRTTNVPETNTGTSNYEDDDWEMKLEKKEKPIIKSEKDNISSQGGHTGELMVIVDITKLDGNIHSKFDRNSVNDAAAASTMRKRIEDDFSTYAKDSNLLSNGTLIPCGSSVWKNALIRLRNERPGHYFCPIFPPKK